MNPTGTRVLGWAPGQGAGPRGIFPTVHPDDLERFRAAWDEAVARRRDPEDAIVVRVRAHDGSWRYLETRTRNLTDDPAVRGIMLTSRDVTRHLPAEQQVVLLSRILETSDHVVVVTDRERRVVYANDFTRRRFGVRPGDSAMAFLVPGDRSRIDREVVPALDVLGTWNGELTFRAVDGTAMAVAATIQRHPESPGGLPVTSMIAHDITELKRVQDQLEHQATHDPLTGLPNRALFREMGDQALARAERDGTAIAVLFIDLDNFKPVNDTLGHAAGDELLTHIARRLRAVVRRGDIVARFGGDEFVVLCEHSAGPHEMLELAQRLIAVLSEPVRVSDTTVRVGASIGIAIGHGGLTVDSLIRDADAALYQAKAQGRGRAVLFGTRT